NGSGDNTGDQWNKTSVVIAKSGVALAVSATGSTINCNGGFSTITATGVGGSPTYTYKLNAGAFQSTNTFSGNLAGTYTITIKDVLSNTASTVLTINQPTLITSSASATPILCNGGTSTITVTASGGTGSLTYNKNGGTFQASNIFSANAAGNYTITARDANLCTKTTTLVITQPTAMTFTAPTLTTPLCNGGTGSVVISASGGTGSKTYTINPLGPQSNTTGNFTGLVAQTYTVTSTDANNCTKTTTLTLTQPALLSLGTVSITPPVCNGGSGSVSINASGGTGTKTFTISPSGPQSNTTGNFTGLVAQTYTITVTDANNCSKTSTVIMTEPAAQVVTATSLVACEGTPVTLVGSPAGGTFSLPNPYSGPGTTYTYTFTNGLGCTAVSAPASISRHTVTLDSITSTATYVCQGGNAFVSVKPHGQYCTPHNMFNTCGSEYINVVQFNTINNTTPCDSIGYHDYTAISTSVTAGNTYTLTLGDAVYFTGDQWGVYIDYNQNGVYDEEGEYMVFPASGGTQSIPVTIAPTAFNGNCRMRVRLIWSGTMDPCNTSSWGETEDYTLTISGGVNNTQTPYTYVWNNNTNSTYNTPNASSTLVTQINAYQTFVVNVTSSEGCTAQATYAIGTVPALLIDSIRATPSEVCPGGSSQLEVFPHDYSFGCFPSVANPGCSGVEYISNVSIANLNHSTACDSIGYKDYSNLSANVSVGSTYTLSLNDGNYFYGDTWIVFIDYNHNGVLNDAGEVYNFPAAGALTQYALTIPPYAFNGSVRMRVRLTFGGYPNPCSNVLWGEIEDYTLNISGGATPLPPISFTWSNNLNSTLSTTNTAVVNATNITAPEWYHIDVQDINGCHQTDSLHVTINCGLNLQLQLYLQGYYAGSGTMNPALMNQGVGFNPNLCDSIIVNLRSASAPYTILTSCTALLQTNGTANAVFSTSPGVPFYIEVLHRNSIGTWSKNPVPANTTSYTFSDQITKAYGDNQVEVETGIWAFYSGELNFDENIDLLDQSLLEVDINNFASGYLATDLNGDGNVDLLDSPVIETNINGFIFSNHP
ncbi:MAG TPA: GEVED domain-containing protein, partial [Chitinophagaceae bacterium]|nr:GEVED domain-containing protein [Chitinophagaceae bacterium]